MIYCHCQVLFVLLGLPSSPSQGQCSVRWGERWMPRGRGAESLCGAGGHEAGAKQSALAPCQSDGLILNISPPARLKDPRAARDIHLTLILHPRGYRAGANSLCQGSASGRGLKPPLRQWLLDPGLGTIPGQGHRHSGCHSLKPPCEHHQP